MTAKACERCGVVKPLEEFSPHRKTEDGRNRVCKECVSYRKRQHSHTHAFDVPKRNIGTWHMVERELLKLLQPRALPVDAA